MFSLFSFNVMLLFLVKLEYSFILDVYFGKNINVYLMGEINDFGNYFLVIIGSL